MSKRPTIASLTEQLKNAELRAEIAESNQGTRIENCTIGAINEDHVEAIIALANAAKANAIAIEAIASKAKVQFETGIYISGAK